MLNQHVIKRAPKLKTSTKFTLLSPPFKVRRKHTTSDELRRFSFFMGKFTAQSNDELALS